MANMNQYLPYEHYMKQLDGRIELYRETGQVIESN